MVYVKHELIKATVIEKKKKNLICASFCSCHLHFLGLEGRVQQKPLP